MNTYETVLLTVLTSVMTLFFILCIVVVVFVLKLIGSLRVAVAKAEAMIDSVESAATVITDVKGPMAAFKLIKNIVDIVSKTKK